MVELPEISGNRQPQVTVTEKDCATAAAAYRGKKTMIVNFGSPTVQGGGASAGENDPESELCRVSTLYRCLAWADLWKNYYLPNKVKKPVMADMIYSPDIIFFKSSTSELLPDEDWFKADVLTAPLPNLTEMPVKVQNVSLPRLKDGEGEDRLYEHFADICRDSRKKGIRLLVAPKPSRSYPMDETVIMELFRKAVAEYGEYFTVTGDQTGTFAPVSPGQLKELLYEQYSDSCQKAYTAGIRAIRLAKAPQNIGIEDEILQEAFRKAADEYKYFFVEFTSEELEQLLTKRFIRILRIAKSKGSQVLILPTPNEDCQIDETILAGALKTAVKNEGCGLETIEIAVSPEFVRRSSLDSFQEAFLENQGPALPKVFDNCGSMIDFRDWCEDCMDEAGMYGHWHFPDENAKAWEEYSSMFPKQVKHPRVADNECIEELLTLFAGNEIFLKNGKEINETLLSRITSKKAAEKDRKKKSELLLKRVKKVVDGLENNGEFSEDYLLKTIYGVCRFFFEYRRSCFFTKTEMRLFYELEMIVVHQKLKLAENYGGASGALMYMLIFDVIISIINRFPPYYGEFSILLGWGLWIPAGCSNLYTDAVSYKKFRSGLQDLDFWEAEYAWLVNEKDRRIDEKDPDYYEKLQQHYNMEYSIAFPQYGIDEGDDEVLKVFGDGEVPREL